MNRSKAVRFVTTAALAFLAGAHGSAFAFAIFTVGDGCAFSDIQSAITAALLSPGEDYVWIVNNKSYSGQHIVVADQDVDIEGGFSDCNDFDPGTAHTTISGAGNDGGPVFEITGSSHVYLGNLVITGARRGLETFGGGVGFSGHGGLTLALTIVNDNEADYGAGIRFQGSGGTATLTLLHDTFISGNRASYWGGGIQIDGQARLLALSPDSTVAGNTAKYDGGGIMIIGPARADLGSPGYPAIGGFVTGNTADYGGGIELRQSDTGDEAALRTFAYDDSHPTTIDNNRATTYGGALYMSGKAYACLYAPNLDSNRATWGAAIFANGSSRILLNPGAAYCGPETVSTLGGSETCLAGQAQCNTLSGHLTQDKNGIPTAGSVITSLSTPLSARHIRIQNSIAGFLIDSEETTTSFSRCLFSGNSLSGALISVTWLSQSVFTLMNCTVADNAVGSTTLVTTFDYPVQNPINLDVNYSIIDQPGKPVTSLPIAVNFGFNYVLVADAAGLPTGDPRNVEGRPTYVDALNSDYHLAPIAQTALDFAEGPIGDVDLDGLPSGVDLPGIANAFGLEDLGAYERQFVCAADEIFCNGFDH
jgi:predicted outer membrane repeat protein